MLSGKLITLKAISINMKTLALSGLTLVISLFLIVSGCRKPDTASGKIKIRINIPQFHLPADNYLCSVVLADETADNLIDWHNMAYKLVVGRARNARGLIKLPTKWEVKEVDNA